MDWSLMMLIGGGAAIVIALAFCFFGYRLARFLLPLCGLVIFEGALYIFVYSLFQLDELGKWLFFCGSSVSIYIILFFLKRVAGFFAGLMGSALLLLYIVYALRPPVSFLYPACFALCLVAGLLAAVYKRTGVIVFSSMLGASAATFIWLYMFFEGLNPETLTIYGNVLVPLEQFLSQNAYLLAGISLCLTAAGIVVQIFWTSYKQILSGDAGEGHRRRKKKDRTQGWLGEDDTAVRETEDLDI